MSAFTPAGSGGLPLSATVTGATTDNPARILIAAPNVEQYYALPAGTKQYRITVFDGVLKVATAAGTSGTSYSTIPRYCFASDTALTLAGTTLYFQSPTAGHTIEIKSWS